MEIKISIIYPVEPSYILGLLDGLSKISEVKINFLGTDRSSIIKNEYPNINFINIRGSQDSKASPLNKIIRIIKFYIKLILYCITDDSNIYHSHFPNKFLFLDFVIINILLKIRGKKIVHTAHNIDYNFRDQKQSFYKTLIFKFLYRIVNQIIVHNKHSLRILINSYPFTKDKVSIIRIGLNLSAVKTGLSRSEARKLLNIDESSKVLLFFGGINHYKGLDILLVAFSKLIFVDKNYLLLIAGQPRDEIYFKKLNTLIQELGIHDFIRGYFHFIPDQEVEKYFVSSDCCVLPYRAIFQSGVHMLSYSFGVPVIASDVGSFKDEDVLEGITGFIFKPDDPDELMKTILKFFNSRLYFDYDSNRDDIIEWVKELYSWDKIAVSTFSVYKKLIESHG